MLGQTRCAKSGVKPLTRYDDQFITFIRIDYIAPLLTGQTNLHCIFTDDTGGRPDSLTTKYFICILNL